VDHRSILQICIKSGIARVELSQFKGKINPLDPSLIIAPRPRGASVSSQNAYNILNIALTAKLVGYRYYY
jgi:hypothetical protein